MSIQEAIDKKLGVVKGDKSAGPLPVQKLTPYSITVKDLKKIIEQHDHDDCPHTKAWSNAIADMPDKKRVTIDATQLAEVIGVKEETPKPTPLKTAAKSTDTASK